MTPPPSTLRCHLCGEPLREHVPHKCPHGRECREHAAFVLGDTEVKGSGSPQCQQCASALKRQLKLPGVER